MPANDDDSSTPGRGARRRALGRGPGATRLPAPGAGVLPEAELAPESVAVPEAEFAPEPVAVPEAELAPEPEAVPEPETEPVPEPEPEPVPEPEPGPSAELVAEPDPGPQEPAGSDPEPEPEQPVPDDGRFKVRLANFEGPFDLLLQLISRHKLDVTEVALSKVTDEFMVHIRAMGPEWDLDQTTEFLVVAATLLDLKAARLLPTAEVEDEADLALLEARDLLFARLLQYRAYKKIADIFSERLDEEARRYPRTVGLEPHHAELLPEVVISIGAEGFARLAVKAMQPRPKPQVYVDHIHAPLVSVREQAGLVVARLRELGEASFRVLVEDTDDTLTVVARFLALLELYREKAVSLEQEEALGELLVRWTGGEGDGEPTVTDEFDRPPETAGKDGAGKDGAGKDGKETKAERGGAEEEQS
ncbi:segregation and condensation protein A [Streptomyces sp. NPDC059753]|uniref:segregation and condensation protein A n=1 Tax=Streptomyces sp. NPDC059753 TaxID=3346933 RepID=UPI00364C44E2